MARQKPNHQQLVEGLFDLLEAFPDLENRVKDLFTSLVLRKITPIEFEKNVKDCCLDHIKKQIQVVRHGVKDNNLFNAYYDVARYQTHISDAATEWEVDEEILGFLLEREPPPTDPAQRKQLNVPLAVTRKRVLE